MSILRALDQANSITNQTVTTTTETIIATSPKVVTPKDNGFVAILAVCTITLGTGTTSLLMQLRKGTTVAGAVVGNPQNRNGISAGLTYTQVLLNVDTYSITDGVQYVLTVTCNAATANSTVQEAAILILDF